VEPGASRGDRSFEDSRIWLALRTKFGTDFILEGIGVIELARRECIEGNDSEILQLCCLPGGVGT
jgi:hypothetical protein